MSPSRRGQAALEFLTTYGWAFLIILVMIGAISYFGISNPSKLLPSRCVVGSELSCLDYQILEDDGGNPKMSLLVKQGVGKTIYLQQVTCTHEGVTSEIEYVDGSNPDGLPWSPSTKLTIECLTDAPPSLFAGMAGQKVKVTYEITYRESPTGFDHLVAGELYTGVQ